MKNILWIAILTLIFTACGNNGNHQDKMDLEEKRKLLNEKRAALNELTREVTELEEAIEKLSPGEQRRRIVNTKILQKQSFEQFAAVQAQVASNDLVSASSEVMGRVIHLAVREGQSVAKGNLIARIDTDQLDNQISELEASLALATTIYERQSNLWEREIGSEIQLLEARNNKERLEKNLANLNLQKDRATVYAPIGGIVENVFIKQGEMASPGSPIIQIIDMQNLKVVASVPEIYLGKLKRGDEVNIQFPSIGHELTARVSRLGNQINAANRTFDAEIDVRNTGGMIKPNLTAIVNILEYRNEDVFVLPEQVIRREVSGRNYVFVAEDSENGKKVAKHYITTGRSYKGQIVVIEGLAEGTEIITRGARELTEGELITVANSDSNE